MCVFVFFQSARGRGGEGGTERERQPGELWVGGRKRISFLPDCVHGGWFSSSPGALMALVVEGEQRVWRMKDGA